MCIRDRPRSRMLASFGISDAGPVRTNNEDCFLSDDALSLYVVADGMGGHAAGEVASRLAVEAIDQFVRGAQDPAEISSSCGIDPELSYTCLLYTSDAADERSSV